MRLREVRRARPGSTQLTAGSGRALSPGCGWLDGVRGREAPTRSPPSRRPRPGTPVWLRGSPRVGFPSRPCSAVSLCEAAVETSGQVRPGADCGGAAALLSRGPTRRADGCWLLEALHQCQCPARPDLAAGRKMGGPECAEDQAEDLSAQRVTAGARRATEGATAQAVSCPGRGSKVTAGGPLNHILGSLFQRGCVSFFFSP